MTNKLPRQCTDQYLKQCIFPWLKHHATYHLIKFKHQAILQLNKLDMLLWNSSLMPLSHEIFIFLFKTRLLMTIQFLILDYVDRVNCNVNLIDE